MVTVLLAGLVAAACSSAKARFYTLDSTATASGAPVDYAVAVGPVSVPASVDRPQFVIQVAPNRAEIDEFNRWIAPLDDSIARAVAGDLATLLGSSRVVQGPLAYFAPDYRVTIDVQRFETVPNEAVLVDATWAVHKTAGATTRSGRTTAREPVQGKQFDALAAAHSRALATLSTDIATAIRAEAAAKPASRAR